jgi:hypothetical protein
MLQLLNGSQLADNPYRSLRVKYRTDSNLIRFYRGIARRKNNNNSSNVDLGLCVLELSTTEKDFIRTQNGKKKKKKKG